MTKEKMVEIIKMTEQQLWAQVQWDKAHVDLINKEILDTDRTKWYAIYSLMETLEIED